MARTAVPVTYVTRAGVNIPAGQTADTTNNNSVANDGGMFLLMANPDTASHTVTVHLPGNIDGQTITSRTYTLAATGSAGSSQVAGRFPVEEYGNPLQVDCTSALVTFIAYHY